MTAWKKHRRTLGIVFGTIGLAACVALLAQRGMTQLSMSRGESMYRGALPLSGRLVGHDMALPTLATRCINCHAAGTSETRGRDALARFGARLDGASLTGLQSRRGGPATRFDPASLCEVLRTGRDPAQILISSTMPRYDVSETQCRDLWTYLTAQ